MSNSIANLTPLSRQRGFLMNPFRFGGGPAYDPYWANVSLLLHCDGTNGATTFADSSSVTKTATVRSTTVITTSVKQFGTGSMDLPASAHGGVSIPSHADFEILTGDFTFECFINWSDLTQLKGVMSIGYYTTGLDVRMTSGNFALGFGWGITCQFAGAGITLMFLSVTNTAFTPTFGNWYHLVLQRASGVVSGYLDGRAMYGSGTVANSLATGDLWVGDASISNNSIDGYMDEARLTKGVARYTANFTPPTAAFPDF